ncbi:uncharacterized protein LOC109194387 isoform X2 [Oreochromis niloticus]|uniref:uncharacterized protein LOC109194387 isoform X2 n=1 Tax=Oreochromis niloticus TaxID=8128 RepID=UPI0009050220|nr:uncharacterized protein LOC109194387 isoform X2 [Oreochromis niloticus]
MADLLLLVVLMYFFHEIKAQARVPPELTVNPPLITEMDSVILSCQTPSSVSVPQCDFYIASQKLSKGSSCVQTLTATELLKITHKSVPAEVEVRCSYTVQVYSHKHTSPDSQPSTIIINNLRPPKLTVSPLMITETDSVTVNCQAVSVSWCYFIITGDKTAKSGPCLWTLTGAEFLSWTRKSLPVTVEMTCYYIFKYKSPVSNMSAITIQTPRPELTVNPRMIIQPYSVTVNCQTPSSVSVTQCFLYFMRRRKSTFISCQQTLTGTELLSMAQQSSPAEVEVTCFYMSQHKGGQYQSPHSNIYSISIQTPRPELTVNPQMIIETDSVTVNCQTPSSVPVTQCFLYFVRGRNSTSISCQQTLTGTELLFMAQQSSPAEVEVTCFYMSQHKGGQYQSPHGNIYFISIQNPRPELTVNPWTITETDSVTVNCQTPSSVSVTQCFLYFMRRRNSTSISCQQTLTGTELLFMAQQSSAEVEVTCFYMSQHKGGQYQSPHSNISFINIQTENNTLTSAPPPYINFTSDTITRNPTIVPFARKILPIVATGFGVTVGIISLTVALVFAKRRSGDFSNTKKTDQEGSLPRNDNEAFNMISLVPGEDPPKESRSVLLAGSDQLSREESQTENSSVCHVYSTIPEEPDERSLRKVDVVYSTLQYSTNPEKPDKRSSRKTDVVYSTLQLHGNKLKSTVLAKNRR